MTQSVLNQDVLVPALDYNGYVLYASSRPVPEELIREPTGGSIAEPGAVLDEENGRTYVDHETGRYFLPNDPVCVNHTQQIMWLAAPLTGILRAGGAGPLGPPAQGLHHLLGGCTLPCSHWAP